MTKPSPTELIILKVLWKQQPQSAREIHQQIMSELDWSYSSSRKTLERMRDKGLLKQTDSHGINVFTTEVSKVATLAEFAQDFGRRVLELDGPLPVAMFADSKLMDPQEIKELEDMLNDWPEDDSDDD